MDLDGLLARLIEVGGSDMHLKIASPAMARVDGALIPMEERLLTESDLETVLTVVTERTPAKREHFYVAGELDTAYLAEGLGRFRVNGYRQRGAISFAFRFIPKEIPSFSRLGLPDGVSRAGRGAPRARPRHRRDRLGEVDDPRRDRQLDQPQPAAAHRHDRGSDRVRARRLGLHRQPARGRARHRVVHGGAPARAAPGPGRDPDRRASRRGVRQGGAPGGRVGPLRPLHDAHDRRRRDDRPARRVLSARQAADDAPDPRRRPARRRQPAPPSRRRAAAAWQPSR